MGNELPKWMKIALFCISVLCFITAFLFLIIPEIYIGLTDATLLSYFNSNSLIAFTYYMRADGTIVLSFGIFSLVAVKVNDFEKIKKYLEFAILWVNLAICLNIYGILFPATISGIQNMIMNLTIKVVIDVVYLYYYLKQVRA